MLATMTLDSHIPHAWNAAVQEIRRVDASDKPRIAIETIFSMPYIVGNAITMAPVANLSIAALGWTPVEALETYLRLRNFAEDWDAPGMDTYDQHAQPGDRVLDEFKPKTALGQRLLALRRAYVERGGPLLNAETLCEEIRERRGGVRHG